MTPTTIYFSVPGHYTQGETRHETFEAALAEAQAKVVPHGRGLDGYVRAFVDERHVEQRTNGLSDFVARRWEVFHDGTFTLMKEAVAS